MCHWKGIVYNNKIWSCTIYDLKALCAFLALVLELCGVYGDGKFKWYYGYPYITVILNFSQMWALYCLVRFYHVTQQRLKPIKLPAKFLSFKAIVYATWL